MTAKVAQPYLKNRYTFTSTEFFDLYDFFFALVEKQLPPGRRAADSNDTFPTEVIVWTPVIISGLVTAHSGNMYYAFRRHLPG